MSELNLFEGASGSYVEYQISGGEESALLRLTLMEPVRDGGAPARWVLVTTKFGLEEVEMWALARRGPKGLPKRERLLVQFLDRVLEVPGADLEADTEVAGAKLERNGKEKLKVPAGEYLARHVIARADGVELHLWFSPKVPMGGKEGGLVRMESKAGPRWDLYATGTVPVRPAPVATDKGELVQEPEDDEAEHILEEPPQSVPPAPGPKAN